MPHSQTTDQQRHCEEMKQNTDFNTTSSKVNHQYNCKTRKPSRAKPQYQDHTHTYTHTHTHTRTRTHTHTHTGPCTCRKKTTLQQTNINIIAILVWTPHRDTGYGGAKFKHVLLAILPLSFRRCQKNSG